MGGMPWPDVVFWAGFAVIALGMVGGGFLKDRRHRRRTYWLSWLVGGLIMTFGAHAKDPELTIVFAGFCVSMSVLIAFFKTPYLKIAGKIYALSLDDRQPDPPRGDDDAAQPVARPVDSYGTLSAATYWWIWAVFLGLGGLMIADEGWQAGSGWPIVIFTLGAGLTGYVDSSHGFRRVRGQYVQAAVITVGSVPLFLAAPVLYLIAYEIGKRFPQSAPRSVDERNESAINDS